MILKHRPEDFRVVEQLDPQFLGDGPFLVYRVTKRKFTTLEAVSLVAGEAGVEKTAVSFAGLKDRQGVTVQYVSIEGGREVTIDSPELKVSPVGRAARPLTSEAVQGNLFDVVVRSVSHPELSAMRGNLEELRRFGVPNYFDDQRFGCVRHGQGFLLRELLRGNLDEALRRLLAAPSPFDDPAEGAFKAALRREWGNWERCAALTKGRRHESLFRHLEKHPGDFVGAFCFVSSRIRLIHLYAYQSYLWNKCVAAFLREKVGEDGLVPISTDIGPLPCPRWMPPHAEAEIREATFPLLDPRTRLGDEGKRRAVEAVLKLEGIALERLQVEGIPGFVFKGEERGLLLRPGFLRVKPPLPDDKGRGKKVELRFTLPPGSYATIVLKRIFSLGGMEAHEEKRPFRARHRGHRRFRAL